MRRPSPESLELARRCWEAREQGWSWPTVAREVLGTNNAGYARKLGLAHERTRSGNVSSSSPNEALPENVTRQLPPGARWSRTRWGSTAILTLEGRERITQSNQARSKAFRLFPTAKGWALLCPTCSIPHRRVPSVVVPARTIARIARATCRDCGATPTTPR